MTWSVYGRDVAERKREPFKCQTYSLEPIGKHHILSEKFRAVIILTQMVQVYMFCNRIIWWLCQKLILIGFCNESYISPSVRLVCVVFFFKSEVISQNRWWNVHLQKWCSRLFDKNITMPDWLQYILSSSILTVLIWTSFYFSFLLCSQINIHHRYRMLDQ